MSEPTYMCMDCGKRRWNSCFPCCQTARKTRFAYIGPGHLDLLRWMAHERSMDFDEFLRKFGYEKIVLEVEGQMRLM